MKQRTKHILWSVVITLLILILIPTAVIAFGAFNMAATETPGAVEKKLAHWTVHRSVDVRSPEEKNPFADDVDAVSTGLKSFGAMCLQCHGAPQVEPEEFAKGLNPPARELSTVLHEWSDGELFWIVKHGIRMTGMPAFGPTHSDDEIWKVVAAVRQLPDLTQNQEKLLEESSGSGHEHGSGSGHHSEPQPQGEAETSHDQHGSSDEHAHE